MRDTHTVYEVEELKAFTYAMNKAIAVAEYDTNGTFISANPLFLQIVGYSLEELQGQSQSIIFDPDGSDDMHFGSFWGELASGVDKKGEFKRISKHKKTLWFESTFTPILDDDGSVKKVVELTHDTTEAHSKRIETLDTILDPLETLLNGSADMFEVSYNMTSNADKTLKESGTTTKKANEIASDMETMTARIEQMTASIKEISHQTTLSFNKSENAINLATDTNNIISQLGASSHDIGNVIKIISSIAQQTNLLALNATIEAARAGEAGKGFAVVANEVKELAKQTAKATDEITSKIGAIQTDSERSVSAIKEIDEAIKEMSGISSAIASAMEEQAATTNDVSQVVNRSANSIHSIVESIQIVNTAATETEKGCKETQASTEKVGELAERVKTLILKLKRP